jgi:hypothetical protein
MNPLRTTRASRTTGALLAWTIGMLASEVRVALAQEPSKLECIRANEAAQSLRLNGRLRDARTQLRLCVATSCPGPVREDCAERLREVEEAMPTILFAASDFAGNDVPGVRLQIDGGAATRLDGTALAVDPGEHVFRFAAEDARTVELKLTIEADAKDRREHVVFPAPREVRASGQSSQRAVGLAVGGAGVVAVAIGALFGVEAKFTYDAAYARCPAGPASCDVQGTQGGRDAHSQAMISTIAFLAAGASLGSGAAIFLTAPKSAAVRIEPTAGTSAAGLGITGAW